VRTSSAVLSFLVFFTAGSAAMGSVITLSQLSSDKTPAEWLDATLDFSVVGNELTVVVTNRTDTNPGNPPPTYRINQFFFNSTDDVEGLVLHSMKGWSLSFDKKADGFGRFDYRVRAKLGPPKHQIAPGASRTFVFDILGAGPFDEQDFVTAMSTIPPGHTSAVAAAKFVGGPCCDSAYGATVPEPATLVLVLLGGLAARYRPAR